MCLLLIHFSDLSLSLCDLELRFCDECDFIHFIFVFVLYDEDDLFALIFSLAVGFIHDVCVYCMAKVLKDHYISKTGCIILTSPSNISNIDLFIESVSGKFQSLFVFFSMNQDSFDSLILCDFNAYLKVNAFMCVFTCMLLNMRQRAWMCVCVRVFVYGVHCVLACVYVCVYMHAVCECSFMVFIACLLVFMCVFTCMLCVSVRLWCSLRACSCLCVCLHACCV